MTNEWLAGGENVLHLGGSRTGGGGGGDGSIWSGNNRTEERINKVQDTIWPTFRAQRRILCRNLIRWLVAAARQFLLQLSSSLWMWCCVGQKNFYYFFSVLCSMQIVIVLIESADTWVLFNFKEPSSAVPFQLSLLLRWRTLIVS